MDVRDVWMWELDCEESWVLKNWCFWTVVLEKTLQSPLDCKEIKPLNPKGGLPWIGAVAPILWPLDAKSWLTGKDLDAGNDWGREEKGATKDEIVGWHHRLTGHEFEQTLGYGDGQGSLGVLQFIELQWIGLDSTKQQQQHLIVLGYWFGF